ncbi:MAG: hypothetical protein IT374_08850 [Polyangiaceae bacterium]|nr:hypothetical protein [Polyangiaceae bacterium]
MRPTAAVAVALSLLAPAAHANGRFPMSNQIAKSPALPTTLMVRTSFGVLLSTDAGQSFSWICEPVIGYGGTQDPGVALFSDGSMAVAAFEGLSVSHDGGCTWEQVTENGLGGQYVIDVAAERDRPERGVVVTSTGISPGEYYVQAYETTDSGRGWTKLGAQLESDLLSETIDVAPSNPSRLYVSGVSGEGDLRVGVLARSADRGATWSRTTLKLEGDESVFVAGVDPTEDRRVYLRTRGVDDRLLVSEDAGVTFRELGRTTGAMTGFAVEPTGERVAFGGPMSGLFLGPRTATTIPKLGPQTSVCLFWAGEGLYACGADYTDGFVVGRSGDAGATFAPVLPKLSSIKGPLTTCAPGSKYEQLCAPIWPSMSALFGSNAGGAGGSSGSPAGGGAGAPAAAPASDDGGSCGCRAPRSEGARAAWVAVLAGLGLAAARRRRITGRR